MISLYDRLRYLRKKHHWSQEQLAKRLYCSQQQYSAYECGHTDIPVWVLLRLSSIYHTSCDYLLGLTDDSTPK
ncbi:helix-turn-helix domain-containing protein [Anaerotruncus colihominis]|uniref:helix-turn-helix domain-containing protein n=1 Tax=Anaerotruncus colihominis TaxID=169435 RepID=UPI001F60D1E5|nr:helix-turn-helix transcriptional regulator [Anaerotruncus colihominis]MCQ4734697.1 helix-turn-helix domain-containing protein [Anaerotruncus colihominis]UOX66770.1 helix-turn-helix domain-containing protein [Anaerotruncus colihominis]UWN75132.1 helix-turn-helix domain-containing protein [Anaerotruncus colihominis]